MRNSWQLLTPAASRRVPWKNGLGETLEIASDAAAPGGDWTWRLSIADVPARAEFSIFPGIDRFIACLTGPGLALDRAGVVPREGDALPFAGEESIIGEPLGPGVRDVNLMLRRDRWRGRLALVRGDGLELDAQVVLVYVPDDVQSVRVKMPDGSCDLLPGHTLIASGRVVIVGAPGSVVVACELTQVLISNGCSTELLG